MKEVFAICLGLGLLALSNELGASSATADGALAPTPVLISSAH